MRDDFAVFILTHGRADAVVTYTTLQRQGYTGRLYLLIDNEDAQAARYEARYGAQVLMFDKVAAAATCDAGDNFADRRSDLYARNVCFRLAQELGLRYFLQLDDDYNYFAFHFDDSYAALQPGNRSAWISNLDALFTHIVEYFATIPALTLAFLQTGDLLGGLDGGYSKRVQTYRKAMNTFFCATQRPFCFVGRLNDDVNTYTALQSRGGLFLSINNVVIDQAPTQARPGGMSELYCDRGTYVKSMYTVMYQPSSVRVTLLKSQHPRLHHQIDWACTAPCILAETYRKAPVLRAPVAV